MNREIITEKQGISLISLFIINGSIILPTGVEGGRDLWLSILIALIFAGIMIIIYSRILGSFPQRDLFQILELVFGKIIGKAISLLYIWFAIFLAALVVRDIGEIFGLIIIPDTPMFVIFILASFISLWATKEGIEVLGRIANKVLRPVVGLIGVFILLLMDHASFDNLKPFLYDGIKPVLRGALGAFSFPLGEIIIFTMIFSFLEDDKRILHTYGKGLIIGGLAIFAAGLNNILVLGIDRYSSVYFPSLNAVRLINISRVIQRIELVGFVIVLLGGFIKISICMLGASKGVAKVFEFKNYRFITTPLILIMIILAQISFTGIIDLVFFSSKIWPYYALIFQVIIPLIILIAIKGKSGKARDAGGVANE